MLEPALPEEPALPGDVFMLESPSYAISSASYNISFMYHMSGLGMGGLSLKGKNATGTWEDLWSVAGGGWALVALADCV